MKNAIHEACRRGDLSAVRVLVTANPSWVDADDDQGWRPVFYAAIARHAGVVRFLIQSGADLSAHEGAVLHLARKVPSNQDTVALLITHGVLDAHVRPASNLDRQLLVAVFLADEFRVRALLHLHPGLATTADGGGDTPLHHAARHGDTAIARALIGAGADLNVCNQRGQTALYGAAQRGHIATVRLLLPQRVEPGAALTVEIRDLQVLLRQQAGRPDAVELGKLLDAYAGRHSPSTGRGGALGIQRQDVMGPMAPNDENV